MKIKLTPEPWDGKEAVSATWLESPTVRAFALAGRSEIIRVEIIGGDLAVYPERSALHRALIAAFGLNAA